MAAIAVSGTQKALRPVTLSITGLSAATQYTLVITSHGTGGHANTVPFTTEGSGNFTATYIPSQPSTTYTATVNNLPSSQVSTSFVVGGVSA